MQPKVKRLLFIFVLCLVSSLICGQSPQNPSITEMKVTPPESIPAGICTSSPSGYLENDKTHSTILSDKELGHYVNLKLREGYTITLYPRTKSGVFVDLNCNRGK